MVLQKIYFQYWLTYWCNSLLLRLLWNLREIFCNDKFLILKVWYYLLGWVLYSCSAGWVLSPNTFRCKFRCSRPGVFLGKGVLKTCSKFKGEHPCRSNFIEITLRHECSSVNLLNTFSYEHLWTTASENLEKMKQ